MRLLACLLLSTACCASWAHGYPERAINMVTGFAAGGSLDVIVRQVAQSLSAELGQPVTVENRTGATGTIAASYVARSAPDGYTLLFGVAGNLAVAPATMKSVDYDPVTAFAPISEVARGPYVLVVNAGLPVKNLQELVAYARQRPGALNYGSSGMGSVQHFAGDMLSRAAGLDMVHVPYKGGGQSYPALMAGDIHLLFDTMPGPQIFAQSGKVKPLAVTGEQRLKTYPDVGTFAEQGYPAVDVRFMYGVVAPAGTPAPIVQTLNKALHKALLTKEMKASMAHQELEPSPGTPQAFGQLIATEARRWKEIVKATGFEPQ